MTFVIAEAGSCHDGSIDKALKLIDVAHVAGADAVKFQTFRASTLAARRRASDYLATYQRYEMPLGWLPLLKARADAAGIEFMTTVYHVDYIAEVAPFVRRWKIASFEAGDRDFLIAHVPYGRPLIVSTGMMTERDVESLTSWWGRCGDARPMMRLLHCVSAYPCAPEDINLRVAARLGGLSDHTGHALTGALAVAAGATMLEVHFRLDETHDANPDCACALDPGGLSYYIGYVRLAERMLGSGVKRPTESERAMAAYRVRSA